MKVMQIHENAHMIMSYEEAQTSKTEIIWSNLAEITLEQAVSAWLSTLSRLTRLNYRSGIDKLIERGMFTPEISLQVFSLVNHEGVIDRIKQISDWSECTRQARAACYISFTGFLSRRFQGLIKKAIPCKEGNAKTFYRVYEKVCTHAMTQAQWLSFLESLREINYRDYLMAKIILQGGKRVNEVISITTNRINWASRQIIFKQSKTKGVNKETVITYPQSILDQLKGYIGDRSGLVFTTTSGGPVSLRQLAITFEKAGIKAKICFKVTPHVLRATTVTYLKQQGFADSDIMRVTGHASAEMVYAYDKSLMAENASKKVSLVY